MLYLCSSVANFQDIPFHVLPHQQNKAVDKHRGLGSGRNSKHIFALHHRHVRKGSRGYLPLSPGSCLAKRPTSTSACCSAVVWCRTYGTCVSVTGRDKCSKRQHLYFIKEHEDLIKPDCRTAQKPEKNHLSSPWASR